MTTTAVPTDLSDRIARRLAELQRQLDAIPPEADRPLAMTRAQSRDLDAKHAEIKERQRGLRGASDEIASFDDLALDKKWIDDISPIRSTICLELLAVPSPTKTREQKALVENLTFSIKLIDRGLGYTTIGMIVDLSSLRLGELLQAAGYPVNGDALRSPLGWRGPLEEVVKRFTTRTKQRDLALQSLEEALMDDADRERRDLLHAQYRTVLHTLAIRTDDTGLRLVAFDPVTGDPLPLAAMSDLQRAAFEWHEQTARPPVGR